MLHLQSRPKVNADVEEAQCQRILRWLNDQPKFSVVYVFYGSLERFGTAQVKELAVGLEHSGYSFLWSICVSPPKMNHLYIAQIVMFFQKDFWRGSEEEEEE